MCVYVIIVITVDILLYPVSTLYCTLLYIFVFETFSSIVSPY